MCDRKIAFLVQRDAFQSVNGCKGFSSMSQRIKQMCKEM